MSKKYNDNLNLENIEFDLNKAMGLIDKKFVKKFLI